VGKIIDPFQGCACQMADLARDFVQKIHLGIKELMLIDMEAGIESFGRGMERGVDTVLTIVEPSFDSLALAEKIRFMAEGIGIPAIQAILNKIPSLEIEEKVRKELENKQIKVSGAVYLDPQISKAGFTGKKVPDNTDAAAQVMKIAAALLSEQK
jgi:CO dehydrogenase maturation factor